MASFLELTWTDEVTGMTGYLVIDRLVRGASGGGLRMREGCTLDEVRDLAQAMSLKEAIVYSHEDRYLPFGGGKGGIDCSPYEPRAREVLGRYVAAMKPLLERFWSTGEDFGVRQEALEEAAGAIGLRSTIDAALALLPDAEAGLARVRAGFAVDVDGVSLADLVGGYGVAEVALASAVHLGVCGPGGGGVGEPGGPRALIQGFGSMGGATARYLAKAAVPVVGICDAQGLVSNPDGLEVERLLLTRDAFGCIDRTQLRVADIQAPASQWLDVDAEILVPAAMSYVLTAANAAHVRAKLIVEAANAPTRPEAEPALTARGVVVLPDFLANVGTNAWWWWTLFGDIEPDAASAFSKISRTLRALVDEVLPSARAQGVSPRTVALAVARQRAEEVRVRLADA